MRAGRLRVEHVGMQAAQTDMSRDDPLPVADALRQAHAGARQRQRLPRVAARADDRAALDLGVRLPRQPPDLMRECARALIYQPPGLERTLAYNGRVRLPV